MLNISVKLYGLADKSTYWNAVNSVREDLTAAGLDAGGAAGRSKGEACIIA